MKIIDFHTHIYPESILFGSDFPLWDSVKETESFLRLDLHTDEQEKIAFRKAETILKISS